MEQDVIANLKQTINEALPQFQALPYFKSACNSVVDEYGIIIFNCILKARDQIDKVAVALEQKQLLPSKIATLENRISEIGSERTKRENREELKKINVEIEKAKADLNSNIDAEVAASVVFVNRMIKEAKEALERVGNFTEIAQGQIK